MTEEVLVTATRHSVVTEQVPLLDIEAVSRRLGVPVRVDVKVGDDWSQV